VNSFRLDNFRRLVAGGLAGGAALALAACGAAGPSGPTTAQITAAIQKATSVHISGSVTLKGTAESLNLAMLRTGDMSGTVTSGTEPPITLILTGKTAYVLLTAAVLKSVVGPSVSCNGVCGKYLAVTGSQASSLTSDISLTSLLKQFTSNLGGQTRAGTTTVNGQAAIVLKDPDGSTLDVAANGPPYPLKLIATSGGTSGTLVFSQWNSVPAPAAPAASDLVNPAKL
jgi:hypothetical protein